MNKPQILLLSNGAGEDSIAARVASYLENVTPHAFPLVGEGGAYRQAVNRHHQPAPIPVVGPTAVMPSGGLIPEGWSSLKTDVRGGLLGLLWQQLSWLRAHRKDYQLVVCVGDLWSVLMAVLSGLRPMLFIGTAKSNYHHCYSWPEILVLRLFKVRSLVRDEITAAHLRRHDVVAAWVGNAMMDGLEPLGLDLGVGEDGLGIAMFPGSRQGTYTALPRMLEVYRLLLDRLGARSAHSRPEEGIAGVKAPAALVCLAPGIDVERLAAACGQYTFVASGEKRGVIGELVGEGVRVKLLREALADALRVCQIAFGVAGTAHEEAAGFGLPVVSYDAQAKGKLGWYRGRQKGLLGEALSVVEDDNTAICNELLSLLVNPEERLRRGHIGKQRLGPAGGSCGMARVIELMAKGVVPDNARLKACSVLAE